MHVVTELTELYGITMKMSYIIGYDSPVGISPRTFADAVPGVYGRLVAFSLSAQVGSPITFPRTDLASQFLTMCISAGQSTQIGAFADTGASDKKA
jgi:hypothetical protein